MASIGQIRHKMNPKLIPKVRNSYENSNPTTLRKWNHLWFFVEQNTENTLLGLDNWEAIVDYLDLFDLINFADVSTVARQAARLVFRRKYAAAKFELRMIGLTMMTWTPESWFSILNVSSLKCLRNFGDLILELDICIYYAFKKENQKQIRKFISHINKFSADSRKKLRIPEYLSILSENPVQNVDEIVVWTVSNANRLIDDMPKLKKFQICICFGIEIEILNQILLSAAAHRSLSVLTFHFCGVNAMGECANVQVKLNRLMVMELWSVALQEDGRSQISMDNNVSVILNRIQDWKCCLNFWIVLTHIWPGWMFQEHCHHHSQFELEKEKKNRFSIQFVRQLFRQEVFFLFYFSKVFVFFLSPKFKHYIKIDFPFDSCFNFSIRKCKNISFSSEDNI